MQNSSSSQSVQKVNRRTLQPLQPWPKTFLSNKSRLHKRKKIMFLHLQWCLHTAHSRQDTTGWLNIFNPANNRFVTTFKKLSNATSPTRQDAHKDLDSTNVFSSPPGTQHNGDHFFLRREILSSVRKTRP
jgi:hypothetical protein